MKQWLDSKNLCLYGQGAIFYMVL